MWFAQHGLQVVGLDRAPAMVAALRNRAPEFPVILGDAHWLPIREGVVDVVVFVTTLEFLEDPRGAVSEAVRVARQGVVLVVLNRWSLGGFSRRWGPQARRVLVGQARDYSLPSLQALVRQAVGKRVQTVRWASTLYPTCLWRKRGYLPLGDVIGMAVRLTVPAVRSPTVQTLRQEAK